MAGRETLQMRTGEENGVRTDTDFLTALRREIGAHQKECASMTRAKLVFVISLLGLGSSSLGTTKTSSLLYLAPIVGYLFDLYMLGFDFGIKRAGLFMLRSPAAAPLEQRWEELVRLYRDPFSQHLIAWTWPPQCPECYFLRMNQTSAG